MAAIYSTDGGYAEASKCYDEKMTQLERYQKLDQVNALYKAIPAALRGTVGVSLLTVAVLWSSVDHAFLLGWLGVAISIVLLRSVSVWRYSKARIDEFNVESWAREALFWALISGLSWGSVSVLFISPNDVLSAMYIVLMCLGLIAVGVVTMGVYFPVFIAFSVPIVLLFVASYFYLGGPFFYSIAAASGLFYPVMISFARSSEKAFLEKSQLVFENENLIGELRIQKETAESAVSAKNTFLAAASHDLRQPLHASGLFIDALRSLKLGAEADQVIGKLSQSTGALNGLLHGLLDISRLDANVVEYLPDNRALNPVVHRICDEYQGLAEQNGLSLEVLLDERLYVYSDDVLLERIIRNLVDNAVKFTDTGAVRVSAKLLDDNSGNGAVALVIADTGRGIPVDQQENVFSEFTQLNNSQRDRQKGLGLGLAIVKKLCDLMEIELLMHSEPDLGTSFTLTLPIGEAVTETPLPDAEDLQLESRVILVIDDEVDILDGMRKMLEADGVIIVTATSATEAINKFDENGLLPDLIITDFRLSENDNGIEAVKRLRDEFNADIKAILVTGDTSPDRLLLAQSAKLPILYKPVTPAHLRETIQAVLG